MREVMASTVGAVEIQRLKHKHELKVVCFALDASAGTGRPVKRRVSCQAGRSCRAVVLTVRSREPQAPPQRGMFPRCSASPMCGRGTFPQVS